MEYKSMNYESSITWPEKSCFVRYNRKYLKAPKKFGFMLLVFNIVSEYNIIVLGLNVWAEVKILSQRASSFKADSLVHAQIIDKNTIVMEQM